jgi:fumarate reductase subunit C
MAEHKHGSMDTAVHEKTFNGFVKFVKNAVIVIIVVLILLAIFNG